MRLTIHEDNFEIVCYFKKTRTYNYLTEQFDYKIGIFYYEDYDSYDDDKKISMRYREMTLSHPFLGAICTNSKECSSFSDAKEYAFNYQEGLNKSSIEHFRDGLKEWGFDAEIDFKPNTKK